MLFLEIPPLEFSFKEMVVGSIPTERTIIRFSKVFWKKGRFEGPTPMLNRSWVQIATKEWTAGILQLHGYIHPDAEVL